MANTSKEVKQRYQEAAYIEVGETYANTAAAARA